MTYNVVRGGPPNGPPRTVLLAGRCIGGRAQVDYIRIWLVSEFSQNFRRTPHREVKCIFKLVYIFAYVYIIFILFLFLTTAKIIDLLL